MNVYTAEQMQRIDRAAVKHGVPGIDLMRNAGEEVFRFIERSLDIEDGIVVIAGGGNNGGDGFRIAELCAKNGYDPDVLLLGTRDRVQGDAALCLRDCETVVREIVEITGPEQLEDVSDYLFSADLIVDAVFGTGLTGEVRGIAADIIRMMNATEAIIVAVDIPSGTDASTGEAPLAVQADYTVTFGGLKVGHVFNPGRMHSGEVHVADIGFPAEVVDTEEPFARALVVREAARLLPIRPFDAHKGAMGRVFVLAGSAGMTGAATLVARSVLRAGAGMATVGCPESLNDILEVKLTEAMTVPLPEVRRKRCLALRGLGVIREKAADVNVLAIGPGIGSYHETIELVCRLIGPFEGTAVIDADAITAFAGNVGLLRESPCRAVITPHYGELARLMDTPVADVVADPVRAAKNAARATGKIVLLKGSPTVICDYEGRLWLNRSGNEGMATAGMGDVLTGIIAGFAAQGVPLFEAAVLGAFVHGMAGDYASDDLGMLSLMAGDVIEYLPDVLLDVSDYG